MTESNTVALLVKGIDNQFFQGMLKIFEEELKQLKYLFHKSVHIHESLSLALD